MVTNDLVPEGIIERFPPGPGEGVGGQNVGRAEKEDDPDAERRRRARLTDADPAPSFGAVAQAIPIAPGVQRAQSEYQEALKQRATRVAPQIEATQQALAQPRPPVEAPPTLPAPPSLGLTPFLSPVEGERPENTIAKLIQGVGLLAVGVAGRKDARASLAALTGALKGWQEGDKERADRAFADWQAQSDTLLRNWKTRRETWRDIMDDRAMSQADRNKMLELSLLKEGLPLDVAKANLEGEVYLQGELDKWVAHVDSVGLARAQMAQSKELAEERFATMLQISSNKIDRAKEDQEKLLEQYTPDVLEKLGQQWITTGKFTGVGLGKSGQVVRAKVVEAGLQWARANGIDVSNLPALQAEIAAAKQGLNTVQRQESLVMAFVNNFDRATKFAQELSRKVERGQAPVFNRWILAGRQNVAGDPDVAAFEAQVNVIASEYARIMVGTAQGDATTRDEARKKINTALSPQQFDAVVKVLLQDTEFRRQGYEQEKKSLADIVKMTTTPTGAKPTARKTEEGRIRVRRKSDGQTGTIEPKDLTDAYERL